uniref:Transposase Tc1-like domain-containing protein n=1 Tax=Oncorhynchus mykiss TaxID=8022 RepID=A0A8K9UYT4_ONCMY
MTNRIQKYLIYIRIQTLLEVTKNQMCQLIDLQKSLGHANISVDESTIRKTQNKNGVHGRKPRKKPLLSKKNIAARLRFAKEHLDVPQCYWKNILWTEYFKIKLSCLEGTYNPMCGEKRHSTPTSKPHPHCKVWWREHCGLGLLCCRRAWTACNHRRKTEFPSLSRHFSGEFKAICKAKLLTTCTAVLANCSLCFQD